MAVVEEYEPPAAAGLQQNEVLDATLDINDTGNEDNGDAHGDKLLRQ